MYPQDQAAPGKLTGRLDEAHERDLGAFGQSWKYREEDRLEGRVVRIAERDDGEREPFQIIEVERADGSTASVFADKWKLRQLMEREKPQVGDMVAFGYYGMVPAREGGNDWADFALVVDRQAEHADIAEDEAGAQTQAARQRERDDLDAALGR